MPSLVDDFTIEKVRSSKKKFTLESENEANEDHIEDIVHSVPLKKLYYRTRTFVNDLDELYTQEKRAHIIKYCNWKLRKWANQKKM